MADSQRIDDLRRRVQRDPTSIAFAQLAEECRRAGHFQEAVDVCRAGLELHPGYLSARVTLGRALIELGDLDVALAELGHVLKSAPDNLAAIRGIAEIHHRQGHLSEALAQYRAALGLARNDPDLQRTVDELARKVEPVPAPASADGLSFEQMQNELLQNLPPPPPVKLAAPPRVETAIASEPAPAVPSLDTEGKAERPPIAHADASADPPAGREETFAESPLPSEETSASSVDAESPFAPVVSIERVDVGASQYTAERARAVRMIGALEQWIDAIHVARAQPRP
jgi:tetratricopeptide (TPR) repeat protein